ncbi:hypothetical protein KCU62_g5932, partial [Aureobasidium sp. EXF-3399]
MNFRGRTRHEKFRSGTHDQATVASGAGEASTETEAPITPSGAEIEQVDDGYLLPNNASVREAYVIINVNGLVRIQESILGDYLRNVFTEPGDYSRAPKVGQARGEVAITWLEIMHTCVRRLAQRDPKRVPKCFVMTQHRRPGPRSEKGDAGDKWKWTWDKHDADMPCPNVDNTEDVGPHQCLKVVDEHTLWLLNPSPGDFDRQEVFDRSNHAQEMAEAARIAEESDSDVDDLGGDAAYDVVTLPEYRSSSPVENREQGYNDTSSTSSHAQETTDTEVLHGGEASDRGQVNTTSGSASPGHVRPLTVASDFGGDAARDTVTLEDNRMSTPVENRAQGHNDPSSSPSGSSGKGVINRVRNASREVSRKFKSLGRSSTRRGSTPPEPGSLSQATSTAEVGLGKSQRVSRKSRTPIWDIFMGRLRPSTTPPDATATSAPAQLLPPLEQGIPEFGDVVGLTDRIDNVEMRSAILPTRVRPNPGREHSAQVPGDHSVSLEARSPSSMTQRRRN